MKTNRSTRGGASLFLIAAWLCTSRVGLSAEKLLGPGTTNSADKAACQQQLNIIYGAIQEYQRRNQKLPDWLSDLVPDFIHDRNVLVCPFVMNTGNLKKWKETLRSSVFGDPASCTYAYEFCSEKISSVPPITCREYKQRQMGLVGLSVPIVRCIAHRPILNLAFDGNIYESPREWEDNFIKAPADKLILHRIPPKVGDQKDEVLRMVHPRNPQTGRQMLDLSNQYNALLFHLSQLDQGGKLLATHPGGLQKIGEEVFDIRGLVHLTAANYPIPFPEKVEDIAVNQKCRQIHFLHGTMFSAPAGTNIASYVIHHGDGRRHEVAITYGKDVKTRWFNRKEKSELENPKVAWASSPEQIGTTGKSLRLYLTTWKNPSQDSEVKSIDFVSRMTPSAPFLVAITVE